MKEVAHAEKVMKGMHASHWRESMVTSFDSGIEIQDLEKFGEHLVETLNIRDNEHKRKVVQYFKKATMKATAKNTLHEIKLELNEFTSLYGFLGSFTAEDRTVTIAYAFHSLTFAVNMLDAGGPSPENMRAIKNTYARHTALRTLRDEGVIPEIGYCD